VNFVVGEILESGGDFAAAKAHPPLRSARPYACLNQKRGREENNEAVDAFLRHRALPFALEASDRPAFGLIAGPAQEAGANPEL
jgi:hypothetical protein